jgi:DNA-binding response OmpR family regulator
MASILIVEDEDLVGRMMRLNLRGEGHEVTWVKSAEEARDLMEGRTFDLVVMDVMLPGVDGMNATKKLRQSGVAASVLMVTAMNRVGDRVKGLDSGADDYLAKPFSVEEFIARVRSLLKRNRL